MMKFIVWKAKDGWRWRLVSGNKKITASGEGYVSKYNAVRACKRIRQEANRAPIEVKG